MALRHASRAVALPLLAGLVLLAGAGAARGTEDRTVAGAGSSPAADPWVDPAGDEAGDDAGDDAPRDPGALPPSRG